MAVGLCYTAFSGRPWQLGMRNTCKYNLLLFLPTMQRFSRNQNSILQTVYLTPALMSLNLTILLSPLVSCVEGLSLVWTLPQYVPSASGVGSHCHNLHSCQPAGVFIFQFNNPDYTWWWLADDRLGSLVLGFPSSLCSDILSRIKCSSSQCHVLIQPAQHLSRSHFRLHPKLCTISSNSKCALPQTAPLV